VQPVLSYDEIWVGFSSIEEILLLLDYNMWLEIEHGNEPENVKIEILRGPKRDFENVVTEHLAENYEDFVLKRLKCARCGNEILWEPHLVTCPTRFRGTGSDQKCGAPLELVRYEFGDSFVREKAGLALAWTFPSRKCVITQRVSYRLFKKDWFPPDTELCVSLAELRSTIRALLTEEVDRLSFKLPLRDPAKLLGRRDICPRGATIAAKHADYLDIRDKFVTLKHWLSGQTVNHPEFVDKGEQARGIAPLVPPIAAPAVRASKPDVPVWDSQRRELRFRGKLCKAYPKTPAPNQVSILEALDEAGWPTRISSVRDPDGEILIDRRLGETLRSLNNRLKYISFRADGTGNSVIWEPASKNKTIK